MFGQRCPFWKRRNFVFWTLLVGLLCLAMMMGTPAPATGTGASNIPFVKIPLKPTGKNLTHLKFPDLSVTSISWKGAETKDVSEIRITATIKNVGQVASKATTVSGIFLREKGKTSKTSFRIGALKPGASWKLTWRVKRALGKNRAVFTVNDPVNKKNNTRELSIPYIPPLAKKFPVHLHPAPEILKKPKATPDLAVSAITFDKSGLKKTGSCRVKIEIRNVGTATSRARPVLVTLRQDKEPVMRKVFKVPPLKPKEHFVLWETFRPQPGENLFVATVRDPYNPANNTMKKYYKPSFVALKAVPGHLMIPGHRIKKKSGSTTSAKSTKEKVRGVPPKPIEISKAVATSKKSGNRRSATRQGEVFAILHPHAHEVVALGRPYKIQWGMPEQAEDTRLSLILHALDTPRPVPDLTLAENLDPSTRSFLWNVNPALPPGEYRLSVVAERGTALESESVSFRLNFVRFAINNRIVTPEAPSIGEEVMVTALIGNGGADAKNAFVGRITIEGPSYRLVKTEEIEPVEAWGGLRSLSTYFRPPLPGRYHVTFDLDVTHQYPHSTDAIHPEDKVLTFDVSPLPDLLLWINKVSNGVLNEEKTFSIVVKNVGTARSEETSVLFRLTGEQERSFPVRALNPGERVTFSVTKSWEQRSGVKTYWAKVDPYNRIKESNETNNEIGDVLRIYTDRASLPAQGEEAPPRLEVEGVYGLEDDVTAGKPYDVTVRLKNVSPDRRILSPTRIRIEGPRVLRRITPPNEFAVSNLWPGEAHDITFRVQWDTPGPARFKVKQRVRYEHGYTFHKELFAKTLTVRENPENHQNVANVMMKRKPLPVLGQGKSLTLLTPNRETFWVKGEGVQIAWTGEAAPSYTVTLFPDRHPDRPVTLGTEVTQNTLRYEVSQDLAAGFYRVKVQGADGGGMSEAFEIRGNEKPDLRIKAASITSGLSGDSANPYRIHIQAIIENTGGLEKKPFLVKFSVNGPGHNKEIETGPLMGQRTCFVEAVLDVKTVGPHAIKVTVDSLNTVDESDETNNTFQNMNYRCRGFPDLALRCRQKGNTMFFYIKNIGDAPSHDTQVVYYFHTTAFPLSVKSIPAGSVVVKTMPLYWNATARVGWPFSAGINVSTVNKLPELRYDNNFCKGTFVQPYDTKSDDAYYRYWKTWFTIEDKTRPLQFTDVIDNNGNTTHASFVFYIRNRTKQFITPPVRAVLKINQRGTHITRVYQIPELFPEDDSGHQDFYHIVYHSPLSTSDGDIVYTLTLIKGNESLQVSQGVVKPGIIN